LNYIADDRNKGGGKETRYLLLLRGASFHGKDKGLRIPLKILLNSWQLRRV